MDEEEIFYLLLNRNKMKLKTILTACNEAQGYIECIPLFIKTWKKFGIEIKIVMIMSDIPEELKEYSEHFILFEPLEGISTAFTSQYIRLLYPSLIEGDGGVMITDVDMIPISKDFFLGIDEDDDTFVHFYNGQYNPVKMTAMCYNIATPKVWREVNHISTESEIKLILRYSYPTNYRVKSGNRGDDSWYRDQLDLHALISAFSRTIKKLIPNFRRLDRMKEPSLKVKYTDYHFSLHPKTEENSKLMLSKKHFITYGDNFYIKSRERLRKEVEEMGVFDTITVYTQDVKEDEEYSKYLSNPDFKRVSESRRGGGYWMWKPYVIWKKLQEIEDDDILVYTDAGCSVRRPERANELFRFLTGNDYLTVRLPSKYTDKRWTKKAVIEYFGVGDEITSTSQYQAGVMAMRKTKKTMEIYERWWKICCEHPELLDDNTSDECEGFRENRHDQSVWSILVKTSGADGSCLYPFRETRHRDKPQNVFIDLRHGLFNRLFPLFCVAYYAKNKNIIINIRWIDKIGRVNTVMDENIMKPTEILGSLFQKMPKNIKITNQKPPPKRIQFDKLKHCHDDVHLFPFYDIVDVELGVHIEKKLGPKYYTNLLNVKIDHLTELRRYVMKEFELHEIEFIDLQNHVGVQMRVTDGFFKDNRDSIITSFERLIATGDNIFLSTDDIELHKKYRRCDNVIVYDNLEKFQNNDIGSIISFTDAVLLSKCNTIHLTRGSSFGAFSFFLTNSHEVSYLD